MEEKYIIITIGIILLGVTLASVFLRGRKPDSGYIPDSNNTITTPVATNSPVMPYGEVKNIQLAQVLTFADFSLKLTKVELDNRCPADAKCSQPGTTIVSGEFIDSTGTTTKAIELKKITTFGSYSVSLVRVDPDAIGGYKIANQEYRFTLNVQKIDL